MQPYKRSMRLRNIRGSEEIIAVSSRVLKEPKQYKGRWNKVFGNDNPIYIEIGMGKGKFLTTLAEMNPDTNYIGIERYSSVLIRALEKCNDEELPNLRFLCFDAKELEEIFAEGEVKRIYLNFSDPWPKDRHAKRRLTSRNFLERYEKVLDGSGRIEFKTDNRALFDFSVEEIKEAGWRLEEVTYDLHASGYAEGNVMTEYEEKFSGMGNPICRLAAYRK